MEDGKSDINAKKAFKQILISRGYEQVQITSKPSDIIAFKNKEKFFFEIKVANEMKKGGGFGAATLTEWRQALETPNNYFFVIAWHQGDNENYEFQEYSPKDFLTCSTVPPAKIYFKIDRNGIPKVKRQKAIEATEDIIKKLIKTDDELRQGSY